MANENSFGSYCDASSELGLVLEVSRRHVTILLKDGSTITGTVSSRALEVATGDVITFEVRDGNAFVTGAKPAERALFRSYRGVLKRMGANIDRLFVITSVDANLNPSAIDRMLIAAKVQGIPMTLVANKSDLGVSVASPFFSVYSDLGIEVLTCSAKTDHGLDPIREILAKPNVRVAALCGVSGVGKSTILNRLVPGAKARTGEVSERTGQGKQTTSQPRGFLYKEEGTESKIIIDFPGVQFFGLSHVQPTQVAEAFEEFEERKSACRFVNCRHLKEPDCAVLEAVEEGEIAPWRYSSYLGILDEIEEARKY